MLQTAAKRILDGFQQHQERCVFPLHRKEAALNSLGACFHVDLHQMNA